VKHYQSHCLKMTVTILKNSRAITARPLTNNTTISPD
jgi:hypothetical protein